MQIKIIKIIEMIASCGTCNVAKSHLFYTSGSLYWLYALII